MWITTRSRWHTAAHCSAGTVNAIAIAGDIREPSKVLKEAVNTGLLDLARPVAVLFIAVLHFIDNADRPAELIGQYMDATAPGSYLAISHAMAVDRPSVNNAAKVYEQSRSPGAMRFRSRPEIEALFGNVTLVDPGVVLVPRWHPELTDDLEAPPVEETGIPRPGGIGAPQLTGPGQRSGTPGVLPTPEELARAWKQAVERTSLVSVSGRRLLPFLTALAGTLLDGLTAERPDPAGANRVGAALVDAHFTEVDALNRTVAVLHSALIAGAAALPGGTDRLGQLLGQLTAGYAQGLQDRTRAEQEQITAAAFEARVAAEQARWNSEARLEAVFADSVIGIAIAEIDGTIVEVNRALCDMLGFSEPEIISRTFWQFVHPDDVPGFWKDVEDLLAGAHNHLRVEKPYYRKDGEQVWTNLVLSLIRDPDGSPDTWSR